MADFKTKYNASVTFPATNLQALPSSSTRTEGWTSSGVDNTSTLALDYLVGGQLTVCGGAAPTDLKSLEVYAYGAFNQVPVYPDLFSAGTEGTEGTATVHDEEQRGCGLVLLWSATIDTGSGEVYTMPPRSIRQAFGETPPFWAIFVTHDTGQNLHNAGNSFYLTPILVQSV
jgi:hypothetical protein